MKHLIQIVTLLMLGTVAHSQAASSALSASAPVKYTDGTTLNASDIAGYTWSCSFTPTGGSAGACGGFSGGSVTGSNPNTSVTFTAPGSGGQACFQVLVTTKAGVSSALSAATCKAFVPLTPNPPGNVAVTVTLTLNLTSASPITVAQVGKAVVTVKH